MDHASALARDYEYDEPRINFSIDSSRRGSKEDPEVQHKALGLEKSAYNHGIRMLKREHLNSSNLKKHIYRPLRIDNPSAVIDYVGNLIILVDELGRDKASPINDDYFIRPEKDSQINFNINTSNPSVVIPRTTGLDAEKYVVGIHKIKRFLEGLLLPAIYDRLWSKDVEGISIVGNLSVGIQE